MPSFVQFRSLSLKVADEMASLAIQTAKKNAFSPIAVCVMDPWGHALVTKRMEDCPPMAFAPLAQHKATTCVGMKMSTRAYGDKYLSADGTPDVYCRLLNQISSLQGETVGFPGGVLIRSSQGEIIGSIGVSGAAGAEDEYCALQAVQLSSVAKEVETEPANHSCNTLLEKHS